MTHLDRLLHGITRMTVDDDHRHVSTTFMQGLVPDVHFDRSAPLSARRAAVAMLEGLTDMLTRVGSYEHTHDWDFHHEVELYDGRVCHFDGTDIHIDLTFNNGTSIQDHVAGIDEADQPMTFTIDLNGQYSPIDDPDRDDDEYSPAGQGFAEYHVTADRESLLVIPLDQVARISFGYCS